MSTAQRTYQHHPRCDDNGWNHFVRHPTNSGVQVGVCADCETKGRKQ